jgi:hypothetical protein
LYRIKQLALVKEEVCAYGKEGTENFIAHYLEKFIAAKN